MYDRHNHFSYKHSSKLTNLTNYTNHHVKVDGNFSLVDVQYHQSSCCLSVCLSLCVCLSVCHCVCLCVCSHVLRTVQRHHPLLSSSISQPAVFTTTTTEPLLQSQPAQPLCRSDMLVPANPYLQTGLSVSLFLSLCLCLSVCLLLCLDYGCATLVNIVS